MANNDEKTTLTNIVNHIDYVQIKRRRQIIYMIFLFISLFSISFIFFSNAITKIDVSINGGMFSMLQVIFLMILTTISAVCFLLLFIDFNKSDKKTKNQKIVSNILDGDEKRLYDIIQEKNEILQKNLVYESGFSKTKVTRI